MMNVQIEHTALQLAQAEAALQEAQQRHEDALKEIVVIEGRIEAINTRRMQIRTDLSTGALDDREAGGLLALADEDAADLNELLLDAQTRAAAAVPAAEQNALSMANNAVERAGREVAFQALHDRVQEIERVFLDALSTLYQQGQSLGRGQSLSGIYRISHDLRRVAMHNVVPGQYGGRHE